MLATRVSEMNTLKVQPLNPDAWREGKTTAERGYGGKWQRARVGHLSHFPICWYCEQEGRVTAATVVDHIIPHRGDMVIFWDVTSWRSSCGPCHSAKTAREEGGIGASRKG